MLNKHSIQLNDICFDRKYFHSASLRIMEPPGGGELDCYLVVVLFIDHGMKEYGVYNSDMGKTIEQFSQLMHKLGLPKLSQAEKARLLSEKHGELRFHRDARASRLEALNKAALEAGQSVQGQSGDRPINGRR